VLDKVAAGGLGPVGRLDALLEQCPHHQADLIAQGPSFTFCRPSTCHAGAPDLVAHASRPDRLVVDGLRPHPRALPEIYLTVGDRAR